MVDVSRYAVVTQLYRSVPWNCLIICGRAGPTIVLSSASRKRVESRATSTLKRMKPRKRGFCKTEVVVFIRRCFLPSLAAKQSVVPKESKNQSALLCRSASANIEIHCDNYSVSWSIARKKWRCQQKELVRNANV